MSVSGVNLNSVLQQLQATAAQTGVNPTPKTAPANPDVDFSNALGAAIDRIDALKQTAVAQGQAFERGEPGIGINDVMVDMQKASLGFEMGVQVRNRVVNAYKEIMNMQV